MVIADIPLWIWGAFMGFVLAMLALDLGVFNRNPHKVSTKEALTWSIVWITISLAFGAVIFLWWDRMRPGHPMPNDEAGYAYLAGYLIEKALSVDNIFVFLMIFEYFKVPDKFQHRVLFWGVLGALVFRGAFIFAGSALLRHFSWMMLLFGAFLVYTGVRMAFTREHRVDPEKNPVVKLYRRYVPSTEGFAEGVFIRKVDAKWLATPLLLVLVVIEVTDIVFALDSIPAVLAVTDEPFLVFTSNVFAILGLRALYFALSGLMKKFRYLSLGLAAVLVFVGAKMLYGYAEKLWPEMLPKLPVWLSIAVVVVLLGIAIGASLSGSGKGGDIPTGKVPS